MLFSLLLNYWDTTVSVCACRVASLAELRITMVYSNCSVYAAALPTAQLTIQHQHTVPACVL